MSSKQLILSTYRQLLKEVDKQVFKKKNLMISHENFIKKFLLFTMKVHISE